MNSSSADWVTPHSHEPNPVVPQGDATIILIARGAARHFALDALRALQYTEIPNCFIASTGHDRTGPFRFGGVTVTDLLAATVPVDAIISHMDFMSADGYGTRLTAPQIGSTPPPLLAYMVDGAPLQRAQGLVRLVVASEIDAALHQVKWLARIEVALLERT